MLLKILSSPDNFLECAQFFYNIIIYNLELLQ